jgi:hypothetical protein
MSKACMSVETIQRKPSVPEVGYSVGLHACVRCGQLRFDLEYRTAVFWGDVPGIWTTQEFEFLEEGSGVFSA